MDALAGSRHRPLLLGHRGCRGALPENTIAAFDHALQSGCDGFEFDVRRTSDGVGLICHDPEFLGRRVAKYAYQDFQKLPSEMEQRGFRPVSPINICNLQDVFERFAGRAFLNLELKDEGLEQHVAELWRRRPDVRGVVSSFLPDVVTRIHSIAPDIPVGFIFDSADGLRYWERLPVQYVFVQFRILTRAIIEEMHAAGRQVMTWTVNEQKRIKELAEWGIDGLISDDPILLRNTFNREA